MKWIKKDISIKVFRGNGEEGEKMVSACCCNGLAIHRSYLRSGEFSKDWTITLIKLGDKFKSGYASLTDAKAVAKELLELTNWKRMTLKEWGRCTQIKDKAHTICYGGYYD